MPVLFVKKRNQQFLPNMDPCIEQFGRQRYNRLQKGWAFFFRWEILPFIPVDELRPFYSEERGRPSKELHVAMGAMLLQQMFDQTDEEVAESVMFDMCWQYALGISEDPETSPTSARAPSGRYAR